MADVAPYRGLSLEEMVLVHELTHALQDQYFDLERFIDGDPLSDEGTARTALVEGDASLVMFDFFAGVPIESVPGVGDALRAALTGAEGMAGASPDGVSPDLPGVKEMAAAPAWLRGRLILRKQLTDFAGGLALHKPCYGC